MSEIEREAEQMMSRIQAVFSAQKSPEDFYNALMSFCDQCPSLGDYARWVEEQGRPVYDVQPLVIDRDNAWVAYLQGRLSLADYARVFTGQAEQEEQADGRE